MVCKQIVCRYIFLFLNEMLECKTKVSRQFCFADIFFLNGLVLYIIFILKI